MPVITLTEPTYRKLQALAEPFVDTEESVILAALDALSERKAQPFDRNRNRGDEDNIMILDVNSHTNLTHTRIRAASVDGSTIYHPNWNSMMQALLVIGRKQLASFETLKMVTSARLREGLYEGEGFKYIPDADLSVQGLSAQDAWGVALDLARHLQIPVKVTFEWHDNRKAAYPGRMAEISWKPH